MAYELTIESIKLHCEPDAAILDGLDDCIIGVNQENYLVYSYAQFLKHFRFQGMPMDEAIEWVEFNIINLMPSAKFEVVYEIDYL